MTITVDQIANLRGLTPEDACLHLYDLARGVSAEQAIVEVGVYMGKSLAYLALGARHGNQAQVFGVDPWDLPGDRYAYHLRPARPRTGRLRAPFTSPFVFRSARDTMRRFGLMPSANLIKAFSTDVAAEWAGPRVGLLYVDGDHTYDGVTGDIEAWLPHMVEGGIMAFDDYEPNFPEVVQGVDDAQRSGALHTLTVHCARLAVARVAARQ